MSVALWRGERRWRLNGRCQAAATYVSDLRYADVSIQALIGEEADTEEDDKLTHVFLADATTMTDASSPLLAIDLYDEPGRTFGSWPAGTPRFPPIRASPT
ncbi:DUF6924 domain-containing protein [Streptomyces sp. NPDC003328]